MAQDWHFAHLSSFAMGGAGLVFAEAAAVEERGRITYGDLGIWSDAHADALKPALRFIQGQGAAAGVQIAHAGRKASMQRPWHGNGPMDERDTGARRRALGHRRAQPLADAGGLDRACRTGQCRPRADPRRLRGGSPARRCRRGRRARNPRRSRLPAAQFPVADLEPSGRWLWRRPGRPNALSAGSRPGGARGIWSENKPLFYRISSVDSVEGGWEIEDSVVFAGALKEIGVDIVDCSSGGIGGPATAVRLPRKYGFQVPFSAQIRREAGVSTMAVGLIVAPGHAEEILQAGDADLIAIAREALYNPFWPHHAAKALGVNGRYEAWPEQYGWWLSRRDRFLGQ